MTQPWTARSARLCGAAALVSVLASFWLLIGSRESALRSAAPNGYSASALGHQGLIRLLQQLGDPVVQQRSRTLPVHCRLVVFAEPGESRGEREDDLVEEWLRQAGSALLVLPKRRGTEDFQHAGWIADDELLALGDVRQRLQQFAGVAGTREPGVIRVPDVGGWRAAWDLPEPTIAGPVQLLQRDGVAPIVQCDQGVLVGALGDLFVLSDPDVIANHGLGQGRNAEFAVALLRRLADGGGIAFDERRHGFALEPSIWRAIGEFPLVLVPVHLLLVLALVLWIANGRFGPVRAAAPAIAAGKSFLVDHIAGLLHSATSPAIAGRRYVRQLLRRAARRLHMPPGGSDEQVRAFVLARVRHAAARQELSRLLDQQFVGTPRAAVQQATQVRAILEDITHGTDR